MNSNYTCYAILTGGAGGILRHDADGMVMLFPDRISTAEAIALYPKNSVGCRPVKVRVTVSAVRAVPDS